MSANHNVNLKKRRQTFACSLNKTFATFTLYFQYHNVSAKVYCSITKQVQTLLVASRKVFILCLYHQETPAVHRLRNWWLALHFDNNFNR